MKKLLTIAACALPLAFGSIASAQTTAAPATASHQNQVVAGWSVKDNVMGKDVYNENNDKVGDIRDVIIAKEGQVSYYVIGAGGFLGLGEHDVAIPYDKVQYDNNRFMLRGYTKDQLKDLPKVELPK